MRQRDPVATNNYLRALSDQDKMMTPKDGSTVSLTINTGEKDGGQGIDWDVDGLRRINFVKAPPQPDSESGPLPGGSTPYTARVHQFPGLIEGPIDEPTPASSELADPLPKPATRRYDQTPPLNAHQIYDASFRLPDPVGYRTELDDPKAREANLPWHKRPIDGTPRPAPEARFKSKRARRIAANVAKLPELLRK